MVSCGTLQVKDHQIINIVKFRDVWRRDHARDFLPGSYLGVTMLRIVDASGYKGIGRRGYASIDRPVAQ